MYQFKMEEIELTEEEKEVAEFILNTVREKNERLVKGDGQGYSPLEWAAFENFKVEFYRNIRLRLKFPMYAQGSMSLTDDAKAIMVTVEKKAK